MKSIEINFDEYTITTNKKKMDMVAIHDFLSNYSGWSNNIPIEKVQTSMDNSLNFWLFHQGNQIGFVRVISDFATIAYLGDIYVLDKYRGQGLSKKLMNAVMNHPNLQGLRRCILLTATADWLYENMVLPNYSNQNYIWNYIIRRFINNSKGIVSFHRIGNFQTTIDLKKTNSEV